LIQLILLALLSYVYRYFVDYIEFIYRLAVQRTFIVFDRSCKGPEGGQKNEQ